jgi:hypothetical protein
MNVEKLIKHLLHIRMQNRPLRWPNSSHQQEAAVRGHNEFYLVTNRTNASAVSARVQAAACSFSVH